MICTSRFSFIHLHKAAGQSINDALLKCIPDAQEIGYHYPISMLPASAASRPIIGVVRNPWDWYVSWYDNGLTSSQMRSLHSELDVQLAALLPDGWMWRRFWFFLGVLPSGRELRGRTSHVDSIHGARGTLHMQIRGVKRWRLRPPPACVDACGKASLEFEVTPGTAFTLDTSRWYHQTSIVPYNGMRSHLGVARFYFDGQPKASRRPQQHGGDMGGGVGGGLGGGSSSEDFVSVDTDSFVSVDTDSFASVDTDLDGAVSAEETVAHPIIACKMHGR